MGINLRIAGRTSVSVGFCTSLGTQQADETNHPHREQHCKPQLGDDEEVRPHPRS